MDRSTVRGIYLSFLLGVHSPRAELDILELEIPIGFQGKQQGHVMKICRNILAGLSLVVFVMVPTSAAAQVAGVVPPVDDYVPGNALPPVPATTPMVAMTLQQAIDRALEVNLGLQSARLDPVLQAWSQRAAQAAFRPTLNSNFGFNNATQQSTSQLDGGARTSTKRTTLNSSLSQTFPWYGGRLSANFNNARTESNNAFSTRNPSFSSSMNLQYTQPLLNGRAADNQRASLETQQIQGEIVELQLDTEAQNLIDDVRRAYWSLRATIEQIEIQRRSLAQQQRLLEENQIRQTAGRATEYQVIQNRAQVANAQQSLLNAEIQWRNQELTFKQLLLGGSDDPLLSQTINPTDTPDLALQAVSVDIEAAIQRALSERSDLRVQREQRRISEVNLAVSQSSALPTLDLSASYALSGVGGNLFDRGSLGGAPVLVESGGYLDGLQSIAGFDTPTWNISLSASYPLGINPAKANLERARLQLRQQDLSLRSQELQIVTQVTSAGLAVENTLLQYQAAQRSREASEQNAAAEQVRFGLGVATNFEVLTAQNQLTSARLSELQALINHINAVEEFARVQRIGN